MRIVTKGATSQSIYFDILDSTSTSGGRKTGLAYNTSGLTAYYVRNGASATAITLVAQTASGTWSSGGFAEVNSTNMPGMYRLDVPNAAFASGADSVVIGIRGATGMVAARYDVQLTAFDLQTASTAQTGDSYARLGAPTGASVSADIAGVPTAMLTKSDGIETGYTLKDAMRLMFSVLCGKVSGLPGSPVFRDVPDTKARVSATTDTGGNRSAVTLDAT